MTQSDSDLMWPNIWPIPSFSTVQINVFQLYLEMQAQRYANFSWFTVLVIYKQAEHRNSFDWSHKWPMAADSPSMFSWTCSVAYDTFFSLTSCPLAMSSESHRISFAMLMIYNFTLRLVQTLLQNTIISITISLIVGPPPGKHGAFLEERKAWTRLPKQVQLPAITNIVISGQDIALSSSVTNLAIRIS